MVKTLNEYPPNYLQIRQFFGKIEEYKPVFAYKDAVYNPFNIKIPEDILYHESVHLEQQKDPDEWWTKYIFDKEFRQEQEVEAFAKQYLWVKKYIPNEGAKEALEEFAGILSSPLYKLNLTKYQAETLLRLKSKQYEKRLSYNA